MSEYRFGDIYVYDEERSTIEKSDIVLINWFERIPGVEAATPRLEASATAETRILGQQHEKLTYLFLGLIPFLTLGHQPSMKRWVMGNTSMLAFQLLLVNQLHLILEVVPKADFSCLAELKLILQ